MVDEFVKLKVAANYEFLHNNFDWQKAQEQIKQIFVFEGGSGSAKTYDIIQFIIVYCQNFENWNKDILIGRDQYSDCEKTVQKDFFKVLKMYGLYDMNKHKRSKPEGYELFGNMISFSGLNGVGSHGERHDIVWVNEVMDCDFEDVRQLNQRCNEVLIADYNPAFTEHWVYDKLIPRPDCKYFHSTQLQNPFLPRGQRDEILGYEPTHPADRELPKNKRRPHPWNIKNGTADDYMWEVYGLGNRAQMEGLIFKDVQYIDSFPDMAYSYGMDFGFTNDPTAIVKSSEDYSNIYAELLCYEPIETPNEIHEYARQRGIYFNLPVTADSSDKYVSGEKGAIEMVKSLKKLGWNIHKVSKTKNVVFHLGTMKKKRIHIVKNDLFHYARREAQNYHWRTINNIAINQPIDDFNHFWDGLRYRHMAFNKPRQTM
jgi:phage terminase large subunit